MSICDDIGDWDQIGCTSDGFDAMSAFGDDLLESWGFTGVGWSDEPPPDLAEGGEWLGGYDPTTQTIHLNPEFLCSAEGMDVADIVAHEVSHAAMDQEGWNLSDGDEEAAAYGFGGSVQDELENECTSVESGSVGEIPEYPWGVSSAP